MLMHTLLAQITAPDGDLVSWGLSSGRWILEQFLQKNYMPACSGLLMLVLAFVQKFELTKIKNKAQLPLLSALLGVISSCAMNLTALAVGAKPHDWLTAVLMGLTIGTGASGFWELVGQKLFSKSAPVAPTAPAEPPAPQAAPQADKK